MRKVTKVVAGLGLVFGLALAIKYGYNTFQTSLYVSEVDSIAESADDIVTHISESLKQKPAKVRLYDRNDRYIATVNPSDSVYALDCVPEHLHALLSKSVSNLPLTIVMDYLDGTPDQPTVDGYIKRVCSEFDKKDLERFYLSEKFFGNQGICAASEQLYGKPVEALSDAQLSYLWYIGNTDNPNTTEYCARNNVTESSLGLVEQSSGVAIIGKAVFSELKNIDDIDLSSGVYNVKLTIDSSMQKELQGLTDNILSNFSFVDSDGRYVDDASIAVFDKTTSTVRCFIPGRTTSRNITNNNFWCRDFISNFYGFRRVMEDDTVYGITLKEVTLPNGDKDHMPMWDLFLSSSFAGDTSNRIGYESAESLADIIYDGQETHLVYQVFTEEGKELYTANTEAHLSLGNANLCQFFSDDESGMTLSMVKPSNDCENFVSLYETDTMSIIGVFGCHNQKTHQTKGAHEAFDDLLNSATTAALKYFPKSNQSVYSVSDAMEGLQYTRLSNQEIVESEFQPALETLSRAPINSAEDKENWEKQYEIISRFIEVNKPFVVEEYHDYMVTSLHDVRVMRTDELVQFSV